MEATDLNILKAVEKIHLQSKDSLLEVENFKKIKKELDFVSSYFQINEIQSVLLASLIQLSCFDELDATTLGTYFGLEKMAFIHYLSHMTSLTDKKIIELKVHYKTAAESYIIKKHLIDFIITNQPIPAELIQMTPEEDSFHEFLGKVDKLSDEKDNKEIDYDFFVYKFKRLIDENRNYKLVNYVVENELKPIECFVFFDVIIDAIAKGENNYHSELQCTADDFTNRNRDTFDFIALFLEGKSKLNSLDLIEKNQNQFGNRHKIQLSQKALKMLEQMEGIKLGFKPSKNENLIYPDIIKKTNLFYNTSEKIQLDTILKSMSHTTFSNLQKRLATNNLPSGVATLLYGAPGTGKTETVYQIAKKFNRPIYKVEISETKSMWFGESQKLVKKIFTDYYEIKKQEKICPILLFNEADAIIGKRKSAGSSNVADTENAIQNVLLEELENFNGILFATSNLVNNLDSAFERRFLFKIQFDAPNIENAAKIWKSKLSQINTKQALHLAQQYKFSGGEMENIARKSVMEEILIGTKVSFDKILSFCDNEKWDKNNTITKIGF